MTNDKQLKELIAATDLKVVHIEKMVHITSQQVGCIVDFLEPFVKNHDRVHKENEKLVKENKNINSRLECALKDISNISENNKAINENNKVISNFVKLLTGTIVVGVLWFMNSYKESLDIQYKAMNEKLQITYQAMIDTHEKFLAKHEVLKNQYL